MSKTSTQKKDLTVLEILKKILPERSRWRLEVVMIIAESGESITSYEIVKELSERGFRKTRISSVHPFLDVLIDAGLYNRKEEWKKLGKRGFKGV